MVLALAWVTAMRFACQYLSCWKFEYRFLLRMLLPQDRSDPWAASNNLQTVALMLLCLSVSRRSGPPRIVVQSAGFHFPV